MFNLHVHVHQQHFIKVHWDREMTLDSQINKHLECASLIQQEELAVTFNLRTHLP